MKSLSMIQTVVEFLNRRDLKGNALEFQREFKADIEAAMKRPRHAGLNKLTERIHKARMEYALWVDSFDNPTLRNWPVESVLDFGDEKFIVQHHIGGLGLKKDLYYYLYWALWTGEFALLKKCVAPLRKGDQCSKFFASRYRNATACSQRCYTRLHNAQNLKDGYFKKNYQAKKKEKLNIARTLAKQNQSLDVIMEKSGLTKLALIKAGIIEEQE
jgi:hypothetical protein